MFLWILICLFLFILMMQIFSKQNEGFGFKRITRSVSKTASKVGSAVGKVAMMGLPASARRVLKNMKKIKPALASFMKKTADIVPIPVPMAVPLAAKKCKP